MNSSKVDSRIIELEQLESKLNIWKEKGISKFRVAVDLGASNFRIFLKCENEEWLKIKFSEVNSSKVLLLKLKDCDKIIKEVYKGKENVVEASCFAIAGPVSSDSPEELYISNYEKGFKFFKKSELPSFIFPKNKTFFLNDMESGCWGIIGAGKENELQKYFGNDFFNNDLNKDIKFNPHSYFVVNMGTGLGSSIIHYSVRNKTYEVIPLEFGHINMFYSTNEFDLKVYNELSKINQKKFGKKVTPEVEDICSGKRAITNLHTSFKRIKTDEKDFELNKEISEKEVGEILKKNEFNLIQYQIKKLFFISQQICTLIPKIKGIFFCGNNICKNRNVKVIEDMKSDLISHFKNPENHRVNWINNTVAYLQNNSSVNFNILGALYYIKVKLEK